MADVVLGNPELYFITGAVRVGVRAPWGCEKYCVNGSLAGNCCLAWGNDDCRNGTLARRVTAKVEQVWQTLGLWVNLGSGHRRYCASSYLKYSKNSASLGPGGDFHDVPRCDTRREMIEFPIH